MPYTRMLYAVFAFVCLLGATGVARAQCVFPNTLTNGQPADASQVMANFNALAACVSPTGSTNSVLYNAAPGLGGVGPLTNGQLVVGATSGPPQAATLTAGSGVTITNAPGSITIAATGGGGGGKPPLFDLTAGVPAWSAFTPFNVGSDTITEASGKAINIFTTNNVGNIHGGYKPAPSPPYRVAILLQATSLGQALSIMPGWYDTSTSRMTVMNWTLVSHLYIQKFSNSSSYNGGFVDFNMAPQQTFWFGLRDDGTNVYYEVSSDGVNFITAFQETKTTGYLSNYGNVFFGLASSTTNGSNMTLRLWDENGLSRAFP